MESKHFKLGIFVLSGLLLFILALFYLGLRDQFRQSFEFVTYFDRSVQGLEVGSSVKLKGVEVGRVKKIDLDVEENKYVRVTMSAVPRNLDNIKNMNEYEAQDYFKNYIVSAVEKGMRASLNYAGITGMKYIELDYIDLQRNDNTLKIPFEVDEVYIPALDSSLEDIVVDVGEILDGIARIDFHKIGKNAENAMTSAEQTMKSLDQFATNDLLTLSKDLSISLNKIDKFITVLEKEVIAAKVSATTESFRDTTTSVRKTLANFDVNSAELNKALASVTKTSELIGKDFSRISDGVMASLDAMEKNLVALSTLSPQVEKVLQGEGKLGAAMVGFTRDLANSLDSFERTMDSVRRLTDYLERHPSSLIKGKN